MKRGFNVFAGVVEKVSIVLMEIISAVQSVAIIGKLKIQMWKILKWNMNVFGSGNLKSNLMLR
jgi:hypothetical protein